MNTAWLGFGIVIFATFVSALGPIYMKKGAATFTLNPRKLLKHPSLLLKNYNVIVGCTVFGVSAIFFVIGLRFGELSVLYPLTALSYVWACLFSTKMLGERMTKQKWFGIAAILIGVTLISLGRTAA